MVGFVNTPDYGHGSRGVTGVLVTNLGTPDEPVSGAVRRYLGEFLSDPRVVELPRLLWLSVLHGIILNVRPRRSARAYARIWTEAGSPLRAITERQATAIEAALRDRVDGPVRVVPAMRYGRPAIADGLERLRRANCTRLLVLPLYPQYSASTSASTFDAVADILKTWRRVPQFRMIVDYHRHDAWVEAVACSIRDHWREYGRKQKLIMSFHGLPRRFLLNGDPYHCQCHASARLIAERLELADDDWQLVFQSRFGREEWLKPYCDHTLVELGENGVASVDVVCPGFAADCLETLEEIAMQNRDIFLSSGGEQYAYIPALNDRPDHIDALVDLIELNLAGWDLRGESVEQLQASRRRALACGAEQ